MAEKLEIRLHTVTDFRWRARNAVARELRKQAEAGALERLPMAGARRCLARLRAIQARGARAIARGMAR